MLFLDYRYLKNKLKIHKVITKINLQGEKGSPPSYWNIFLDKKNSFLYVNNPEDQKKSSGI